MKSSSSQSSSPTLFKPEKNDSKIVETIREHVGSPADPEKKVSRMDLKLHDSERIHIDIGGEGVNEHMGYICGFESSINVNAITRQCAPPNCLIPNLVLIPKWRTQPSYPFSDGFADYITMQNAPLTEKNVSEIARCLRPGGEVGLWISSEFKDNIEKLAKLIDSKPEFEAEDEFNGSAGVSKIKIVSRVKATPSLKISSQSDGDKDSITVRKCA